MINEYYIKIAKPIFIVSLKNHHIMVLPADKYIAEYAPDEEGK